jgi:hypothetical protein
VLVAMTRLNKGHYDLTRAGLLLSCSSDTLTALAAAVQQSDKLYMLPLSIYCRVVY